MLHVLIAGGGTGGHIIPALAIADALQAGPGGVEILFLGTPRGLESKLVPQAGYPLELIQVGQLKNVSLLTRARTLLDLPRAVLRARTLLRTFRPHVVVGVGGYASGPAMAAAILARIPTLAFEPNAAPGLANRLVGKRVSAAAVNFAPAARFFRNAQVTGIPVREAFFALPPRRATALPHLLVFGGSQGARVFNQILPQILPALLEAVPGLTLLHQSGARAADQTQAAFLAAAKSDGTAAIGSAATAPAAATKPAAIIEPTAAAAADSAAAAPAAACDPAAAIDPTALQPASAQTATAPAAVAPAPAETAAAIGSTANPARWQVSAFLDDMPARFAAADLVLARSGASTVAELCAAGKPSLLVPFPLAADDHQARNAAVLQESGAAAMLLEAELTPERLLRELTALFTDRDRLTRMGEHARSLARPDAARHIATMVRALAATHQP